MSSNSAALNVTLCEFVGFHSITAFFLARCTGRPSTGKVPTHNDCGCRNAWSLQTLLQQQPQGRNHALSVTSLTSFI